MQTETSPKQPSATADHSQPAHQTWRPLRLFNAYRLLISGVFLSYAIADFSIKSIGTYNPALFSLVAMAYLAFSVFNMLTIRWRRPEFITQVYLQIAVDIIVITLFMHASGGVQSGFGMLIIVAVAGGSILLAGKLALSFAAFASILVLAEHTYLQINDPEISTAYTQTGLLGAAFFATALLAHALAKRVRESEALAEKRGIDLANMEQLTQYIIQQMQTGVAVIDNRTQLWQINESAKQLLNIKTQKHKPLLSEVCPQLSEHYTHWLKDETTPSERFRTESSTAEILPHFAKLGNSVGTLIFLEDTAAMSQHAQQLKLASLGRLAGSIAHEIRNPLGAISHAGQLLGESAKLDKHDLRLTEIIHTNTQRMNNIIENVLQLGRRDKSQTETIELTPWLDDFIDEFCRGQNITPEIITLSVTPENLTCEFDPNQLHQILWNLCHNGIRHSQAHTEKPQLSLNAGSKNQGTTPYLDIIDNGPGIPEDTQKHLFEPFFTTDAKGTGLGLYIAKELAECNHAHLTYLRAENGGSCFRIIFTDPRRRRNTA